MENPSHNRSPNKNFKLDLNNLKKPQIIQFYKDSSRSHHNSAGKLPDRRERRSQSPDKYSDTYKPILTDSKFERVFYDENGKLIKRRIP